VREQQMVSIRAVAFFGCGTSITTVTGIIFVRQLCLFSRITIQLECNGM
jgi:hypothetical protein